MKQNEEEMNLQQSNYSNEIKSLMDYVVKNNVDISTQEKFTEAMQDWYKQQRQIDIRLQEMPMSNWNKILGLS